MFFNLAATFHETTEQYTKNEGKKWMSTINSALAILRSSEELFALS